MKPWRSTGLLLAVLAAPLGAVQTSELSDVPAPAWQAVMDKIAFHGDFRFRMEGDKDRPNGDDRWRSRIRLRLGANYAVSEELLVGGRLTTGDPDDPRDTNATLGDGFNELEFNLDRLFLTWRPASLESFYVTLGKFANPLARNPVYDELVWYSDVQPEGLAMGQTWSDVGPLDALRAQAGFYVFLEDTLGDVNLGVGELLASSRLSEGARGDLSAAWYGYSNADEVSAATVDDYQILDVIGALTLDAGERPWRLAAEGLANLGTSSSENLGWALGLSYGQARKRGDWGAYYQYQEVENDAVFGPVAGADFLLDHNYRGHVVNIDHMWTDKLLLRLRVLSAEPIESDLSGGFDDTSLRARLDLNVKF